MPNANVIYVYVPKGSKLAGPIEAAAIAAGMSRSKWLLLLAEREIARLEMKKGARKS